MSEIREIFASDMGVVLYGLLLLLFGSVAVISAIEKVSFWIGKPVKSMRQRQEDHETLATTVGIVSDLSEKYSQLEESSNKNDEMIMNELNEIKEMFLDKDINDMRLAILNFANKLVNNPNMAVSKEEYDEIIRTNDRYQEVLHKSGRSNGRVEVSMEVIMKSYSQKFLNV